MSFCYIRVASAMHNAATLSVTLAEPEQALAKIGGCAGSLASTTHDGTPFYLVGTGGWKMKLFVISGRVFIKARWGPYC